MATFSENKWSPPLKNRSNPSSPTFTNPKSHLYAFFRTKDCTCEQQQNTRIPSRVDKRSVFQNTLGVPMGSSGFGRRSLGESRDDSRGLMFLNLGLVCVFFWGDVFLTIYSCAPLSRPFCVWDWGGFSCASRRANCSSRTVVVFCHPFERAKSRYFDGLPHSAGIQFGCLEFAMPIWHLVWKGRKKTERCADYGWFNFVCLISWWRYWIYWCEGMQSSICFEYHVSSICICTIK